MSWTKSRFFMLPALIAGIGLVACSDDKKTNNNPPVTKTVKVVSFTPSATSVAMGGTVTLNWTVENANTVSIVATPPGTALVENSTELSSSVETGAINQDTTFQLTATGANNKTATEQVTITVDVTQVHGVLDFVPAVFEVAPEHVGKNDPPAESQVRRSVKARSTRVDRVFAGADGI